MPLVALAASWTTQIDCHDVKLERRWILRGPAAKALAGRSKSLPLGQAFLAMGLCQGGIDLILEHDSARARTTAGRFKDQLDNLRKEVLSLSQPGREADAVAASARLRGACNDLAIRIAHAGIALYKGSALLLDHPAQRLAREAMFLLVWSCPDPVIECTLDVLSGS
jgi:alkylation response protein AidB-like acyl-CoA dehydrogenase